MSIYSTIKTLYSIVCDAARNPNEVEKAIREMALEDEVNRSIVELEYLLGTLSQVNSNLKSMYIMHYTTGTDRENKKVLLQIEVPFGGNTTKFTTEFNEKQTQNLIDSLNMSLAMVRAGDRLVSAEGRA